MSDPIAIRGFRPGDEHGLLAGYNQVFPTPDGKIQPRSLAHWQWKFLRNPAGGVHATVAEHPAAGIVGCYVTLPVRIRIEGKDAIAGQVVDLYVLPEYRRAGPRPGLFVHCGLEHYKLFGGMEPGKNEFTYGWPVPNWRIGKKYLNYENIRDWDFLFREIAGGIPPRQSSADLEVQQVPRFDQDVDALWRTQQDRTGLAIVRDAAYLNWRYADAHDRSYRLFTCRERSTGALRGLCVYTVSDFLFPHTGFLVDWVCPLDDQDTTVAMVAAAERQAQQDQVGALATLFPQMDPRFLIFQRLGFLVFGTSYFTVVAPFDNRGTVFYREQWYHTCGDSDLV